jgi:predicted peroxiredoxin
MSSNDARVVVNLATGLEDPERVTVAFLIAGAAASAEKQA